MGGIIMIFSLVVLVILSMILQIFNPIIYDFFGLSFNNNLWNREETYLAIFTLVSVGFIGAIDDYLNVRGIGRTK